MRLEENRIPAAASQVDHSRIRCTAAACTTPGHEWGFESPAEVSDSQQCSASFWGRGQLSRPPPPTAEQSRAKQKRNKTRRGLERGRARWCAFVAPQPHGGRPCARTLAVVHQRLAPVPPTTRAPPSTLHEPCTAACRRGVAHKFRPLQPPESSKPGVARGRAAATTAHWRCQAPPKCNRERRQPLSVQRRRAPRAAARAPAPSADRSRRPRRPRLTNNAGGFPALNTHIHTKNMARA